MKTILINLSLCFLCFSAAAEIVTVEGQKYYKVGNKSFFMGNKGSLTDEQGDSILQLAQRAYQDDNADVLKELWGDLHVVYRGSHFGEIMSLILRGHLNAVLRETTPGDFAWNVYDLQSNVTDNVSTYTMFYHACQYRVIKGPFQFETEENTVLIGSSSVTYLG